jgi:hypothetical protein
MPGVIWFGTVAVDFPALAGRGGDRAATEIADGGKLAEQVGSSGLQLRQSVGHSSPS